MSQVPYYDVAQVCLAGHMINYHSMEAPQRDTAHCRKCGRPTISKCPSCKAPLQGEYQVPGAVMIGGRIPARGDPFCHACGEAYPWTDEAIESAKLLAEELDMLSEDERSMLSGSITDVVVEGPRTAAAALRFKRLVGKPGNEVPELMKDLLVAVAAETARKAIWEA